MKLTKLFTLGLVMAFVAISFSPKHAEAQKVGQALNMLDQANKAAQLADKLGGNKVKPSSKPNKPASDPKGLTPEVKKAVKTVANKCAEFAKKMGSAKKGIGDLSDKEIEEYQRCKKLFRGLFMMAWAKYQSELSKTNEKVGKMHPGTLAIAVTLFTDDNIININAAASSMYLFEKEGEVVELVEAMVEDFNQLLDSSTQTEPVITDLAEVLGSSSTGLEF